jgi:NAD(P)-dependent dehydrogenase (short-subunit alcohol dehydrogenase family)
MDFDNLNSEKDFLSWRAYCRSKLANVLFALEFSNRFGDTGITAVSVEPGFVRSEMFREVREGWTWKSILVTLAIPIFYIFTKSSKEGAQTTLHCALDDDVPEYNGQYFV